MDFCISVATQVMLDEIMKKNGDSSRNVVLSPLSLGVVLNMLASGSSRKTLAQFKKFLGSKNVKDLNSKSSIMMSILTNSFAGGSSDSSDSSDQSDSTEVSDSDQYDSDQSDKTDSTDHDTPAQNSPNDNVSMPSGKRSRGYGEEFSVPKKPKKKKEPLIINFVSALWVDHCFPLIPSFEKMAKTTYKTHVANVDFKNEAEKVIGEVNSWAEKETRGLVKNIVSKLSPPLCLANALYFKGDWKLPFDESSTHPEDFYLPNGKTAKVPFMKEEYTYQQYGEFEDFKLLGLPYESGKDKKKKFSMYIFLPHANDGLEDLMKKFNSDSKTLQPNRFHLQEQELLRLWIPKMKFSFDYDAKMVIEAKGLTMPFDRQAADFTKMVRSPLDKVYVDSALQTTCIEVDEEGTVAVAATRVQLPTTAARKVYKSPTLTFVADHPFVFMIVHDVSKLIVFTGAVVNPLLD